MATSPQKFDGRFNALEKALAKSRDPALEILRFKNRCGREEILRYAHRLKDLKRFTQASFGLLFASEPRQLKAEASRWLLKPEKQLLWTAGEMSAYASELRGFLQIERDFESALLIDNLSAARDVLEKSKRDYGYSLWYYENLIGLLEISEGMESHKSLVSTLIDSKAISPNLKFHLFFISMRAERSLSPDRYQEQLRKHAQELFDENSGPGQHGAFRLNFFGDVRFRSPSNILAYEDNASLIDRYLTLVRVLQVCIADSDLSAHREAAEFSIRTLSGRLPDDRLTNLAAMLNIPSEHGPGSNEIRLLRLLDQYTEGNYKQVAEEVVGFGQKGSPNIDIFETVAKASARLPAESVRTAEEKWPRLVGQMKEVILKTPKAAEAAQELLKFAFVFPSLKSSVRLFSFLMREYRHGSRAIPKRFGVLGELNGIAFNPRLASVARTSTVGKEILTNWKARIGASTTCDLYLAYVEKDLDALDALAQVPRSRVEKMKAHVCLETDKRGLAENHFKRLGTTGSVLDALDSIEGLIHVHLLSGDLPKASREIVTSVFAVPMLKARLPIEETMDAIEASHNSELFADISVPVLYDMYVREGISSERDERRAFAYQEYLQMNGISRPSELRVRAPQLDRQCLIYFLKNVCVPSVMDSSVAFASSEELYQERIAVCQLLSEIDKESAEEYSSEIKALTQSVMINRGLQEIERSKIYVDVDGVKALVDRDCRDIYERIRALSMLRRFRNSTEQMLLELNPVFGQSNRAMRIVLPMNERYEAFVQFFATIRNAFVSSNEYGLDVYLSVGIRHGTLSGQLRSALERESLVTVKGDDGKYRKNEYWAERLNDAGWSSDEIEGAQKALAEFSKSIDDLIDEIKGKDLQIRTEERKLDGALFDYSMLRGDLLDVLAKIERKTPYEEALNLVIEKLWDMTDRSLERVRLRFAEHKAQCRMLLDRLSTGATARREWEYATPLDDAIAKARTGIHEELDKVANWFTRTSGESMSDYEIRLAWDIALRMTNNIHPDSPLRPSVAIEGSQKCHGRTLKPFVEVLFMILDNIPKHSKVYGRAPSCEVTIRCGSGKLLLDVKNELGPEIDEKALTKKIKTIIEELRREQASELVRREGGTGLHKIVKSLRIDLGCSFDFAVAVLPGRRFNLLLSISAGRMFV